MPRAVHAIVALVAVVAVVAVLGASAPASACETCACGDPTITALGTERPFAGRFRLALLQDWREWSEPGDAGATRIDAFTTTAAIAYAPSPWLVLGASLPIGARSVVGPDDHVFAWGTADASLDARALFYRTRRHQLALTLGVIVPTTKPATDDHGKLLVDDAQPGNGDLATQAGLFYAYTRPPFAVFSSLRGILATPVTLDIAPGPALLGDVTGQWQPVAPVAITLGVDGRAALAGTSPDGPFGEGVVTFVAAGVLVRTGADVVLGVVARAPVVVLRSDGDREGAAVTASVAVDL